MCFTVGRSEVKVHHTSFGKKRANKNVFDKAEQNGRQEMRTMAEEEPLTLKTVTFFIDFILTLINTDLRLFWLFFVVLV